MALPKAKGPASISLARQARWAFGWCDRRWTETGAVDWCLPWWLKGVLRQWELRNTGMAVFFRPQPLSFLTAATQ
jgi:hypothetical protein